MPELPRLGFGLYRHMLTDEYFRFARQAGATDLVVHLVDYTGQMSAAGGTMDKQVADNQPVGGRNGWATTVGDRSVWSVEYLSKLRARVEKHGLSLHAIENFDPAHWHDVLLAGPKRDEQIEWCRQVIRNLGAAGIPVMGYNFSIAGVAGRVTGPFARGGAESVGLAGIDDTPVPNGTVWNMTYDDRAAPGVLPEIDHEELWTRLAYFLERVLPVAADAGVVLAAHPDDPPAPRVRRQPRLIHKPGLYDRLFRTAPSPANRAELCLGTVQEMRDGSVYELVRALVAEQRIAYVHFRNVVGKVPEYHEVFVDEGDIDLPEIMRILVDGGYDGVLIPDHTPLMECAAPWHAGMAYAMGYLRALLQSEGKRAAGAMHPRVPPLHSTPPSS